MTTNKSKGFTIIELLVVVAIIAVLAAIVLVNVTQYIGKGKNSAIQGNMVTILTNAAVFYDQGNPSTYTGFAATTGYTNPSTAATSAGGTVVNFIPVSGAAFCACSTMNVTNSEPAGTTFCVDSSGSKVKKVQTCAVACTTPATGVCTP